MYILAHGPHGEVSLIQRCERTDRGAITCSGPDLQTEETSAVNMTKLTNAEKALNKLNLTFQRHGWDLNALTEIKVWMPEEEHDHHDDHEHGPDTWMRVNYTVSHSSHNIVYIQCHTHDGGEYICHYKRTGHEEPMVGPNDFLPLPTTSPYQKH